MAEPLVKRHLHIDGNARVEGHTLPYRAHFDASERTDAISETMDGIYIEFDHDRCTDRAMNWMAALSPDDEQALYTAVAREAAAIYNMKRLRGERIDGDARAS